jgi:hypothetical protein
MFEKSFALGILIILIGSSAFAESSCPSLGGRWNCDWITGDQSAVEILQPSESDEFIINGESYVANNQTQHRPGGNSSLSITAVCLKKRELRIQTSWQSEPGGTRYIREIHFIHAKPSDHLLIQGTTSSTESPAFVNPDFFSGSCKPALRH